jgi:hypothetical protein
VLRNIDIEAPGRLSRSDRRAIVLRVSKVRIDEKMAAAIQDRKIVDARSRRTSRTPHGVTMTGGSIAEHEGDRGGKTNR